MNTIIFKARKSERKFYEDDAKYFNIKAQKYGYTANEFRFNIKPDTTNKDFILVEIGEVGSPILIKEEYIEFDGSVLGDVGYNIKFNL